MWDGVDLVGHFYRHVSRCTSSVELDLGSCSIADVSYMQTVYQLNPTLLTKILLAIFGKIAEVNLESQSFFAKTKYMTAAELPDFV